MNKLFKYLTIGLGLSSIIGITVSTLSLNNNQIAIANQQPTISLENNNDAAVQSNTNTLETSIILKQVFNSEQLVDNSIDSGQPITKDIVFSLNDPKSDISVYYSNSAYTVLNLDLNIYKPIGLDSDLFLKNTKFNIYSNQLISSFNENNANGTMQYNINKNDYDELDKSPNWVQNKDDYQNLYVKPQEFTYNIYEQNEKNEVVGKLRWTNKLVFNFYKKPINHFQNRKSLPYAYFFLKLAHVIIKDDQDRIIEDNLLFRPCFAYSYNKTPQTPNDYYFSTVPNQAVKIIFSSDYFTSDSSRNLSANDYVSDQKQLSIYEPQLGDINTGVDKPQNKPQNNFLTIDTSKGKNSVDLNAYSNNANIKLPLLNIDTSNFYFDSDKNHTQTRYKVKIEGLYLKNGYISKKIADQEAQQITFFTNERQTKLNLEFEISDYEFINNQSLSIPIKLFDLNNIHDPDISNNSAELGVNMIINIKPLIEKVNGVSTRQPFHYQIDNISFNSNQYTSLTSDGKKIVYDTHLEICSSSQVLVKTSVLDFNYIKMLSAAIDIERNKYEIKSTYSSNVFDDHYILNDDNQVVENNYDKVLKIAKEQFFGTSNTTGLINNRDFKLAQNIKSSSPSNLSLFKDPFVQTTYNHYNDYNELAYRSNGRMILRYGLTNPNKYFQYIETVIRAYINTHQGAYKGNEIVDISFDMDVLKQEEGSFTNLGDLVAYLNKISNIQKLKYLNVINNDNNITQKDQIVDPTTIVFSINNSNSISATFNLIDKFTFYNNSTHKLISNNIQINSEPLKLSNFNNQVIMINVNEDLLRKKASQATNYEDFIKQNPNVVDFLYIKNNQAIYKAEFLNNDPSLKHTITIQVQLQDKYVFDNNTNLKKFVVGNINWKDENNQISPINIDLSYIDVANVVKNYSSLNDFLDAYKNPNINDWINAIKLQECTDFEGNTIMTNLSDLKSIRFERVQPYNNKLKVIFEANEWKYFQYPGSTTSTITKEFIISNLTFKDQTPVKLKPLTISIDIPLLYNELKKYFENTSNANIYQFLLDENKAFLYYGSNEASIIKIDPYTTACLSSPPNLSANENGININLDLADSYYWVKQEGDINNQYYGTYIAFISYDELRNYNVEVNKPNPQNEVHAISLNVQRINDDASQYNDINSFLNSINNDYKISSYLNFEDQNDISKISNYQAIKTSNNSFNIKITIYSQYFFTNEDPSVKTKTFEINNLLFAGQQGNFKAISVDLNRNALMNLARQYDNVNALVDAFKDKHDYESFKDIIIINKNNIDGLKEITMLKANSDTSIIIRISLNNGYYFVGKSPLIGNQDYIVSNLLFKYDPSQEEALTSVNFTFKGNEFLTKAHEFNNIEELKSWLFDSNNWKSFFNLTFNKDNLNNEKAIKRCNLFATNDVHTFNMQITLNEGYYFVNEDYTNLNKTIVIGNVYFKTEEIPYLFNVDVNFNTKRFYLLTRDHSYSDWVSFINGISSTIMNFTDNYNAILWTNVNDSTIFSLINLQTINNNLVITLQLISGYYFDNNDRSNTQITLTYSQQNLTDNYNKGKAQVDHDIMMNNLTIALSIVIPFAIVFLIIITWIIIVKRKNKKSRDEAGV